MKFNVDEHKLKNDLQRYIAQYLNRLSTYLYDVALRYERSR